jgi:hypothetical protein
MVMSIAGTGYGYEYCWNTAMVISIAGTRRWLLVLLEHGDGY